MYQIGDTVVCGSNGVCTVMEIGPLAIMGKASKNRKFYTLKPYFDNSGRVYLPVDCDEASMRLTMSKDEFEKLISELDSLDKISIVDEKMRETEYKNAVNSSDPRLLVRIIKTMHSRRQARLEIGKKSTAIDERYFRIAEQRLYEEMALALDIERDEAKTFIRKYLDSMYGEQET